MMSRSRKNKAPVLTYPGSSNITSGFRKKKLSESMTIVLVVCQYVLHNSG